MGADDHHAQAFCFAGFCGDNALVADGGAFGYGHPSAIIKSDIEILDLNPETADSLPVAYIFLQLIFDSKVVQQGFVVVLSREAGVG